jgi:site-specific DNA-methyltransferase (adenine-specific)
MAVDRKPRQGRPAARPPRSGHEAELRLLQGECAEVMAGLPEAGVDAVVTDPPYGIDWQGESWDGRAIREAAARAGHERISANEAFEVWCRIWAGECLRVMRPGAHLLAFGSPRTWHRLTAGLEDAGFEIRDTLMWLYGSGMPKTRRYPGDRASALKPAFEPIVLARKPPQGTLAENVARHGTGLLGTGDCRVEGRHPADVAIGHDAGCGEDGCAPGCPVADADVAAGSQLAPSRFLHCPKADRAERDAGCEALPGRVLDLFPNATRRRRSRPARNPHPSVKPIELMRWLVRLGCPPGGLVLDPFTGSGTTGIAAVLERRRFCGIERESAYLEIARARIAHHGGRAARGGKGAVGARPGRSHRDSLPGRRRAIVGPQRDR